MATQCGREGAQNLHRTVCWRSTTVLGRRAHRVSRQPDPRVLSGASLCYRTRTGYGWPSLLSTVLEKSRCFTAHGARQNETRTGQQLTECFLLLFKINSRFLLPAATPSRKDARILFLLSWVSRYISLQNSPTFSSGSAATGVYIRTAISLLHCCSKMNILLPGLTYSLPDTPYVVGPAQQSEICVSLLRYISFSSNEIDSKFPRLDAGSASSVSYPITGERGRRGNVHPSVQFLSCHEPDPVIPSNNQTQHTHFESYLMLAGDIRRNQKCVLQKDSNRSTSIQTEFFSDVQLLRGRLLRFLVDSPSEISRSTYLLLVKFVEATGCVAVSEQLEGTLLKKLRTETVRKLIPSIASELASLLSSEPGVIATSMGRAPKGAAEVFSKSNSLSADEFPYPQEQTSPVTACSKTEKASVSLKDFEAILSVLTLRDTNPNSTFSTSEGWTSSPSKGCTPSTSRGWDVGSTSLLDEVEESTTATQAAKYVFQSVLRSAGAPHPSEDFPVEFQTLPQICNFTPILAKTELPHLIHLASLFQRLSFKPQTNLTTILLNFQSALLREIRLRVTKRRSTVPRSMVYLCLRHTNLFDGISTAEIGGVVELILQTACISLPQQSIPLLLAISRLPRTVGWRPPRESSKDPSKAVFSSLGQEKSLTEIQACGSGSPSGGSAGLASPSGIMKSEEVQGLLELASYSLLGSVYRNLGAVSGKQYSDFIEAIRRLRSVQLINSLSAGFRAKLVEQCSKLFDLSARRALSGFEELLNLTHTPGTLMDANSPLYRGLCQYLESYVRGFRPHSISAWLKLLLKNDIVVAKEACAVISSCINHFVKATTTELSRAYDSNLELSLTPNHAISILRSSRMLAQSQGCSIANDEDSSNFFLALMYFYVTRELLNTRQTISILTCLDKRPPDSKIRELLFQYIQTRVGNCTDRQIAQIAQLLRYSCTTDAPIVPSIAEQVARRFENKALRRREIGACVNTLAILVPILDDAEATPPATLVASANVIANLIVRSKFMRLSPTEDLLTLLELAPYLYQYNSNVREICTQIVTQLSPQNESFAPSASNSKAPLGVQSKTPQSQYESTNETYTPPTEQPTSRTQLNTSRLVRFLTAITNLDFDSVSCIKSVCFRLKSELQNLHDTQLLDIAEALHKLKYSKPKFRKALCAEVLQRTTMRRIPIDLLVIHADALDALNIYNLLDRTLQKTIYLKADAALRQSLRYNGDVRPRRNRKADNRLSGLAIPKSRDDATNRKLSEKSAEVTHEPIHVFKETVMQY